MLNWRAFQKLTAEIAGQGHSKAASARLASLIGDTPIISEDGGVVVMGEQGRVVAQLRPLHFFAEKKSA
jgi:hypothetical protein